MSETVFQIPVSLANRHWVEDLFLAGLALPFRMSLVWDISSPSGDQANLREKVLRLSS